MVKWRTADRVPHRRPRQAIRVTCGIRFEKQDGLPWTSKARRAPSLHGVGPHAARRCPSQARPADWCHANPIVRTSGIRLGWCASRPACIFPHREACGCRRHAQRRQKWHAFAPLRCFSRRCLVSPAVGSFFPPLGRFPRRCVVSRAVALFPAPLHRFSRRCVDFGGAIHNGAA